MSVASAARRSRDVDPPPQQQGGCRSAPVSMRRGRERGGGAGERRALGFGVADLLALAARLDAAAARAAAWGARRAEEVAAAEVGASAGGARSEAPRATGDACEGVSAALSGRAVVGERSAHDEVARHLRREIRVTAAYVDSPATATHRPPEHAASAQKHAHSQRPMPVAVPLAVPVPVASVCTATAAATLQDLNLKSLRGPRGPRVTAGALASARRAPSSARRRAVARPSSASAPSSSDSGVSGEPFDRVSRLLQAQLASGGHGSASDVLLQMLDPGVTDTYLDGLLSRHAPHLAQSFEPSRSSRPAFLSVGAWTASLSRGGAGAEVAREGMRTYLQSVVASGERAAEAAGARPREGLTALEILALSWHDNMARPDAPCCICLDAMEVGQQVILLPCSHGYHKDCIQRWLARSAQCPLCKTVVAPFARATPPPSL
jgi:hypothetical protein